MDFETRISAAMSQRHSLEVACFREFRWKQNPSSISIDFEIIPFQSFFKDTHLNLTFKTANKLLLFDSNFINRRYSNWTFGVKLSYLWIGKVCICDTTSSSVHGCTYLDAIMHLWVGMKISICAWVYWYNWFGLFF